MFRRKSTKQEDPFHRINKWDDGYEYIRDSPLSSPSSSREPPPFFSPPPMTATRPARAATFEPYERDAGKKSSRRDPATSRRTAYPSPPSDDGHNRPRRQPRARSPPPPYRKTRSPSPGRYEDSRRHEDYSARAPPHSRDHSGRPPLESHPTAPIARSKSMREGPPPRSHSRSPSPPPRRRERPREADRPYPRSEGHHRPERRGEHTTRSHGGHAPRKRSPSPLPKSTQKDASHRPGLARAKTTSAKDRFAGLSPRWQQAATAAFQAGSMAALQARSQPGAWNGEKGARVATAALGAAAMGAFKNKKDDGKVKGKSSGSGGRKSSGVDAIGGALGGFLADQFAKRGKGR